MFAFKYEWELYLFNTFFDSLTVLFFRSEFELSPIDEISLFLQNVDIYLQVYEASQLTGTTLS
jgi:hypothetical protein